MKKPIKIFFLISVLIFSLGFLLLLGGSFFLHKVLEEEIDPDITYIQSMKAFLTQNAEGESEKQIKESSMRQDYQHISIYYEKNFSALLPITKEILDLAIAKNEKLFGGTSLVPIDLLVFENLEELRGFSELEAVDGFYSDFDKVLAFHNSKKELILAEDKLALYAFQKMVLHEYTHYVFARKAQNPADYPMWFIEGAAEYIGTDPNEVNFPYFEKISFDQLKSTEQWQEARTIPTGDPYVQSYYAFEFLTSKYGEEVIKQIIDSVDETRNFEESFTEITGLTVLELESMFLSSYKD
ncbi:uncharacterized protein YneF (UPF0154 family) [Planomicrobium stackebrandtii]|uniref:Uncharacterized protein YneF (UPF0154 family) n=1 Tax=Planomicrobium stackebrandtii TaxID=253160 RepID=A0ABU0GXU8_9BACL|nr:hypothetical protein [Planomicrobium stackebrandtii]MDQ0430181.1 uncharacterized protein YneF (UPF0154 family) [Planomicrobium stackebrandtii]